MHLMVTREHLATKGARESPGSRLEFHALQKAHFKTDYHKKKCSSIPRSMPA